MEPNEINETMVQIDLVNRINKVIDELKDENTLLKKEIVRLRWILEHQD